MPPRGRPIRGEVRPADAPGDAPGGAPTPHESHGCVHEMCAVLLANARAKRFVGICHDGAAERASWTVTHPEDGDTMSKSEEYRA